MLSFAFDAIGTKWQIEINQHIESSTQEEIKKEINTTIEQFDSSYSRFKKDSLVTRMSQEAGTYTLPQNAEPMMSLYKQLYQISCGLFTPLIGNTISSTGYDADYSLIPQKNIQPTPAWQDIAIYNHPTLTLKKPTLFDFGAMGKGYLVDLIATILQTHNIHSYIIDASGDIAHKNKEEEALRIALQHPQDSTKAIGVIQLSNQSLCGSAGNKRAWHNYHHIINPKTLSSPKNILATWVTANSTMLADALATYLFLLPAQDLVSQFDFEYAILDKDYTLERSPNFSAEIFT